MFFDVARLFISRLQSTWTSVRDNFNSNEATEFTNYMRQGSDSFGETQFGLDLGGSINHSQVLSQGSDESIAGLAKNLYRQYYLNSHTFYGPIRPLDNFLFKTFTDAFGHFTNLPLLNSLKGLTGNKWLGQLFFPNAKALFNSTTTATTSRSAPSWYNSTKNWLQGMNPLNPANTYKPISTNTLNAGIDATENLVTQIKGRNFKEAFSTIARRFVPALEEVGDFLTMGELGRSLGYSTKQVVKESSIDAVQAAAKNPSLWGKVLAPVGGFFKRFLLPVGAVTTATVWGLHRLPHIPIVSDFLKWSLGGLTDIFVAPGTHAAVARNDVKGISGKLLQGTIMTAVGVGLAALAGVALPAVLGAGALASIAGIVLPAIGTVLASNILFPRSEEEERADNLAVQAPGAEKDLQDWHQRVDDKINTSNR
ncbi:MAG: hypothetical protein SFT81_00765 [Candidatus Caenarcaniphilales bacterium]|nr:hypothetical protein [Candidatus Caenarcaniphilales bacterium]